MGDMELMDGKEYVENVLTTENLDYNLIRERLDNRTIRLLHASMGLCTEAGEFLDALKKWIIYGKPLDPVNLIEELGDGNWYQGLAIDELESSFEEIWDRNIAKLKGRYGEKFSEKNALDRNLEKEREILEGEIDPERLAGFLLNKTVEEIVEVMKETKDQSENEDFD